MFSIVGGVAPAWAVVSSAKARELAKQ
jgi:hypothetical protein